MRLNQNKNFFELFDITEKFDIDLGLLKSKYLALQIKYHPDNFSQNELDKKDKLELSMLLNDAYKVLQDDYLRAEYLLNITANGQYSLATAPALSNQELEDLLESFQQIDTESDLSKLHNIYQATLEEKEVLTRKISAAFMNKDFTKAQNLTIKLKYLINLVNNAKTKLNDANS